jgi:hypothetical protein
MKTYYVCWTFRDRRCCVSARDLPSAARVANALNRRASVTKIILYSSGDF